MSLPRIGTLVSTSEEIKVNLHSHGIGETLHIVLPVCSVGKVVSKGGPEAVKVEFMTTTLGGLLRFQLVKTLYAKQFSVVSTADEETNGQ
jgi:hypothetical protein